jgi:hypothetical protein
MLWEPGIMRRGAYARLLAGKPDALVWRSIAKWTKTKWLHDKEKDMIRESMTDKEEAAMGRTSSWIAIDIALKVVEDYVVTEASKEKYFRSRAWKKEVVSVEKFEDGMFIFRLRNGDFVALEKKVDR